MYSSRRMREVVEEIAKSSGFDLRAGNGSELIIENPPFMDLHIVSKHRNVVAVFHQPAGEFHRYDPEQEFYTDVIPGYGWIPINITLAWNGQQQTCTWLDAEGDIEKFAPALQEELALFA